MTGNITVDIPTCTV